MGNNSGENMLDAAIRFALATIPEDRLRVLFVSLGYGKDESITLETCVEAWNKFGLEFTRPFFSLAQDRLEDEECMRDVRRSFLASLSRADGKNKGGTASNASTSAVGTATKSSGFNNEKWDNAKNVIGYLYGICESGYTTYANAKSAANTAAIQAQAQAQAQQAEIAAQQSVTKLVIVGGGLLIGVVVILAVVSMLRKKG